MSRRNVRVRVDLRLRSIDAPGAWLSGRGDVYLRVSLFGKSLSTKLCPSVFPMHIHEDLEFEKFYYSPLYTWEVVDCLRNEYVEFELYQFGTYGGTNRLATYTAPAYDFLLHPYPSSRVPYYTSPTRFIPLQRSVHFPHTRISPKLELVSTIDITDSLPVSVTLEDALEARRIAELERSAELRKSMENLYIASSIPRYRPLTASYRPLTASEKLDLDLRVDRAIERNKRLKDLELEESLRRSRSKALDDLDYEMRLSRLRRYPLTYPYYY